MTEKADEREHLAAMHRAEQELESTERALEQAHERTSEIAEISRTLRRLGAMNHFAPLVLEAFGGDKDR
jgi:hypothetical protein